jgi:hypothetical protein
MKKNLQKSAILFGTKSNAYLQINRPIFAYSWLFLPIFVYLRICSKSPRIYFAFRAKYPCLFLPIFRHLTCATGIQQPSVKIPPNRVLSDDRLISFTGIQQPSVKILPNRDDRLTNIEAILIKQGKQNRAIYDLQKVTLEKVSLLQAQVKKIKSEKSNELSQKVFNVSNNLIFIILSH